MPEKNPRARLLTPQGIKEYRKWLENTVTQEIIGILKEETRILQIPENALAVPQIASSLYHQKVGADGAIQIIENIEEAAHIGDIEATYGSEETADG